MRNQRLFFRSRYLFYLEGFSYKEKESSRDSQILKFNNFVRYPLENLQIESVPIFTVLVYFENRNVIMSVCILISECSREDT